MNSADIITFLAGVVIGGVLGFAVFMLLLWIATHYKEVDRNDNQ